MEMWKADSLKVMADEIRDKLREGRVFGDPVDFDNQDMMIVAAYWVARNECTTRNIARLELEESITV